MIKYNEREEIISLINDYSKTWDILIKYDENRLDIGIGSDSSEVMSYAECGNAINTMKHILMEKGEASELFGREKNNELAGIIGNIYQTFDGLDLYPSFAEKAANLIYFVIKDHPFSDGNKRIGSFLFLLLLKKNSHLVENIPTPEGLATIALLIAESSPDQKDLIIKLVANLISNEMKIVKLDKTLNETEESKHISKGHASEVFEGSSWRTLIEEMDKLLKSRNDN